MAQKEDKVCNGLIVGLISCILHVSFLIVALKLSGFVQAEEPEHLSELLMELPSPDTPVEVPAPPEPEPPQQEPQPPEPEPPAPEPPAPEPPAPEPPKIEPKPEPPKPEPPKPEPPKIEPKVESPKLDLKPEPPKPEPPKPEPPKPKPLSKLEQIRQRMENSRVVKVEPSPVPPPANPPRITPRKATSTSEINDRLKPHQNNKPTVSAQLNSVRRPTTVSEQSINYAELVVKPIYYNNWTPPTVGNSHPTPVTVELRVTATGQVKSARIITRSDDQRMNESVQNLISTVKQFTPFAQAGVTVSNLTVRVTLDVEVR